MIVVNNFLDALKAYSDRRYFRDQEYVDEQKKAKEWYLMYLSQNEGDCYTEKLTALIN